MRLMTIKVLVVDDDPSIREILSTVLEAINYSVVTAPDGEQALALLEDANDTKSFSLVILDIMMPGLNGLDVLTRMKLRPMTASIPVIMLTANQDPEDIINGYQTGADYYMTKPFTRKQLLFGIESVLGLPIEGLEEDHL
mgnify:CR=1 FL=1